MGGGGVGGFLHALHFIRFSIPNLDIDESQALLIAVAAYPQANGADADPDAERRIAVLQSLTAAARNLRAEMGIPPREQVAGKVYSANAEVLTVAEECSAIFAKLAGVRLTSAPGKAPQGQTAKHAENFDLLLELPEAQTRALKQKLAKQLEQLEEQAEKARARLADENFLAKAPARVVTALRERLADCESQIERIRGALAG